MYITCLQKKACSYNRHTILISFYIFRLSELFEEETDIYMRKDPDPFDERHPSRTDPECELGRMLKLLFRKDHFMTRVCVLIFLFNFYFLFIYF